MNISAELSKFEPGSKEFKFFENVFEKLEPNFVRKSVQESKREVHSKLNKATEKYFQLHIIVNAVIKSAEEYEKSQDPNIGLHSCSKPSSSVHSMYFNLVKRYLPLEGSQKLKLFGLSQDKVSRIHDVRKLESENAAFKKLVEENIDDFCRKLTLCVGGLILPSEDLQRAFNRMIMDLEYKVIFVSSKEIKEQLKKQLREMTKTYYEELSKRASLLSTTLSLHQQKLQFESDLGEYYHKRCHAVFLKIKCFELKILLATYNQETVPALKKISAQLDQSEEKLTADRNEKTVALESYLKLGNEYEQFVNEYAHLIKCIKEQQWAIDELKSRKSQYGASACD